MPIELELLRDVRLFLESDKDRPVTARGLLSRLPDPDKEDSSRER